MRGRASMGRMRCRGNSMGRKVGGDQWGMTVSCRETLSIETREGRDNGRRGWGGG